MNLSQISTLLVRKTHAQQMANQKQVPNIFMKIYYWLQFQVDNSSKSSDSINSFQSSL